MKMTSSPVLTSQRYQAWFNLRANWHYITTTWMKVAGRRRVECAGDFTDGTDLLSPKVWMGRQNS